MRRVNFDEENEESCLRERHRKRPTCQIVKDSQPEGDDLEEESAGQEEREPTGEGEFEESQRDPCYDYGESSLAPSEIQDSQCQELGVPVSSSTPPRQKQSPPRPQQSPPRPQPSSPTQPQWVDYWVTWKGWEGLAFAEKRRVDSFTSMDTDTTSWEPSQGPRRIESASSTESPPRLDNWPRLNDVRTYQASMKRVRRTRRRLCS